MNNLRGSTSYTCDNMFQGRPPNKLIIGFVKSKTVNDDYKANPFKNSENDQEIPQSQTADNPMAPRGPS